LLSRLAAANLGAMDAETPIRTVGAPRPETPRSPFRHPSSTMDTWDSGSRLDEASSGAANDRSPDREERLLRFVDILRTEQARASIAAEGDKTRFRRWRGPGLIMAVVIVAIGAAASLSAIRTLGVRPGAQPDLAFGTAIVRLAPEPNHLAQRDIVDGDIPTGRAVNPAPIRSIPEALSPGNPYRSEPVRADRQMADSPDTAGAIAPTARMTLQPKSIDLLEQRYEADALASQPTMKTAAEVSESGAAKPVLRIYYPQGSSRAEANAQTLSARLDANLVSSDFQTSADLPTDAVIKFSTEKNHTLARMVGKSLGNWGYRWRIENNSGAIGSHPNMIEVWLPR
jgi:hypothetical protein